MCCTRSGFSLDPLASRRHTKAACARSGPLRLKTASAANPASATPSAAGLLLLRMPGIRALPVAGDARHTIAGSGISADGPRAERPSLPVAAKIVGRGRPHMIAAPRAFAEVRETGASDCALDICGSTSVSSFRRNLVMLARTAPSLAIRSRSTASSDDPKDAI